MQYLAVFLLFVVVVVVVLEGGGGIASFRASIISVSVLGAAN